MKILFLTHPESDYGGYNIWNGLCEILGTQNVIDYPYKISYHGRTDTYPSLYTPGEIGITSPFPWTTARDSVKYSLEQIKEKLINNEFNMIVCESPRMTVCNSLKLLKRFLPNKIILHDSEDYEQLREDIIDAFNVRLYLKRELLPTTKLRRNYACIVKPFPFSTYATGPVNNITIPRDIDVLCATGDTHPIRQKIRAIVNSLSNDGWKVDTTCYPWDEYVLRMNRSKIAVAPRGWAFDTTRRWDIPTSGAFLLAEKLDIIETAPMIDGIHCATYMNDASDFKEKLLFYLRNDALRESIALEGQKYLFSHNSNVARAKQLLEWAEAL